MEYCILNLPDEIPIVMYGEILIHISVLSSTIISIFLNEERLYNKSRF